MSSSKPDPLKDQDQHEPDKPDYRNSRPLDLHLTSKAPEVDRAVQELTREFRAKGFIKNITDKLAKNLKLILLNLFHFHVYTPSAFIAFSRDNGWKVPHRSDVIPVLPVHDSFIVARRHEEELKEAMEAAYKKFAPETTAMFKEKEQDPNRFRERPLSEDEPFDNPTLEEILETDWLKRSDKWHRDRQK